MFFKHKCLFGSFPLQPFTHICLWLSTSWHRTSPRWCTPHPSAAPGPAVPWVGSCTLL